MNPKSESHRGTMDLDEKFKIKYKIQIYLISLAARTSDILSWVLRIFVARCYLQYKNTTRDSGKERQTSTGEDKYTALCQCTLKTFEKASLIN